MAHQEGKKAIIAALLANAAIAIAKLTGYAFTGAASMLAEGLHSIADTGNQGLLLLGGRLAKREADEAHSFGFGRERFFWAFVVSIVLFSLGSVFALYEGISKLIHPHEVESFGWALGILFVALILESFSLRTAVHESRPLKGDLSWWQFIRQTKNPELATVLLEDTGALLGLIFAIAGVSLAVVTGEARYDAAGSVAIGLLLGVIAFILARENKSLLIGESATSAQVSALNSAINQTPGVSHVIHIRTMQLSPEELLVAAKVEFDSTVSADQMGSAIDAAELAMRAVVPEAKMIFIEPDTYRADAEARR